MLADTAMDTISESKLEESSAVELARIASIATERAGVAPPSDDQRLYAVDGTVPEPLWHAVEDVLYHPMGRGKIFDKLLLELADLSSFLTNSVRSVTEAKTAG